MSDTIALCRELVQRPSVTPADAGCQELIGQRLQKLGFSLEPMPFGEVSNLWARIGTQAPLFVFAGHTDVVPTGDTGTWAHPPFAADIIDGQLYGRGAADMKGGVAAFVTAVERFMHGLQTKGTSIPGSIGILLTSDEEGPAVDGTARVIDALVARAERIDYALVTEPSSATALGDTVRNGRRGSLGGTLRVQGVQGHVAYPHLADNPVHRALPLLQALCGEHWDDGSEGFPATNLQISNIHAGTGASNVIPDTLEVRFNLRFNPASPPDKIKARVQSLIDTHALDARMQWNPAAEPFHTPANGALLESLAQAIADHTGLTPVVDTAGGTSDGRFIAPTGAQVAEFGPINASIHQINEHVDCADLDSLSSIYEQVLRQLLKK